MDGRRSPVPGGAEGIAEVFTICPKCTLTLVVTTVDLRAGQGYVRCGRCANVFNALIALREGDPSNPPSESARQRIIESAPPASSVQPALGSGVALEPEPEPTPEPFPDQEQETETEPEAFQEPESFLEPELIQEPEPSLEVPAPEEELSFDSADSEAQPEEGSLEFDAAATDVSEIFVSPSQVEHDTGSGSYEAVVMAEEPQPELSEPESFEPESIEPESIELSAELEAEAAPEPDDLSRSDTIAADDWSLLDDDEPPADAESIIEESPFAEAQEPDLEPVEEQPTQETVAGDPAWVQEMFAEAEAEAIRSQTAEQWALESAEIGEDCQSEEPAVVQAARDIKGVSASSGDTVLEPLLAMPPATRRPAWQYITGLALLSLVLLLQVVHHKRKDLVLNASFGPLVSTVYGWFGATIAPRWDLTAYTVRQLGVEAEGTDGSHLRVRLSVQNDSDRVQPLPLVRLTLTDRYDNPVATRDLEPQEYLPSKIADRRLLEPNQRIDGELHVIDPGRAAVGFEIDACLRSETGLIGCANELRHRAPG